MTRRLPPTVKTLQQRRLAAVKLLRGGMTQAEVARVLQVSREAVRRWATAYEAGGLPALRPSPGKRGPRAALTEAELRMVVAEARAQGGGTLAELLTAARRRHPAASLSTSALRRRLMDLRLWPLAA